MCVIIAKNKNGRLPSENELKNCFTYNSNGGGFMYYDKSKKCVVIDKGYMNYTEFLNRFYCLCDENNNFENQPLVIHFRIATDGSASAKNCHGFSLCNSIKKMHNLQQYAKIGVMHNGIIRDYQPPKENIYDISDTMNFILKYLQPILSVSPSLLYSKAFLEGVEIISGSKFAFLDNDNLITCGDFIEDDGLLFSNDSYKDKLYYGYYNSNYVYDYYNKNSIDNGGDYIELKEDYTMSLCSDIEDENGDNDFMVLVRDFHSEKNSKLYYDIKYNEVVEISVDGFELNFYNDVMIYDEKMKLLF